MPLAYARGALHPAQYQLTTAEILYHMPDHPSLLQSFIWQHYDLAPDFPRLHKFLEFWRDHLDGDLHTVRIGARDIFQCRQLRHANHSLTLQ